ncbi:MAG: protein-L-isoaspartate(D-aspartate) O-methyltransferase [Candidatus Woesearchaeota archaeon]|nr:MAG: protein-L-isoaspartate(D-aspartate) O-methyltransferase [Candidatus Woesearchaeota archaeon]
MVIDYNEKRENLVKLLEKKGIYDRYVLEAIGKVKRHLFIPDKIRENSYEDNALPILKDQTISQPYTIAFMLQELELNKGEKVLEIGAGSGYNAALISLIVKPGKVYSVEIDEDLVKYSIKNLKNYKNVKVVHADGSKGYTKAAPYDKVIITAACPTIPEEIIKQVKSEGVIIAPVGDRFTQEMIKCRKEGESLICEKLGRFSFVSLRGEFGF